MSNAAKAEKLIDSTAVQEAGGFMDLDMRGSFVDTIDAWSGLARLSLDPQNIGEPPKLEYLPRFGEMFDMLGISEQEAGSIFDSWMTYNAFNRVLSGGLWAVIGDIDGEMHIAKSRQIGRMSQNVLGLLNHAVSLDLDELHGAIDTFGIHHFDRHSPSAIRRQLERWEAGDEAVSNVFVVAHADNNGNLRKSVKRAKALIEHEGTFVFEAGSAVDLSKIMVAIGSRERQANRKPAVKNIVIEAHGYREGIALGVDGKYTEGVTVSDYTDSVKGADKIGATANDYRRHLGDEFRIILGGCEAAAGKRGINIARAMSEGHHTTVKAPRHKISGIARVNLQGDTTYQRSKFIRTKAVTYTAGAET
ncbi:MAG: hypothetical protein AAB462_00645 [Patescibacteria group bacterium]